MSERPNLVQNAFEQLFGTRKSSASATQSAAVADGPAFSDTLQSAIRTPEIGTGVVAANTKSSVVAGTPDAQLVQTKPASTTPNKTTRAKQVVLTGPFAKPVSRLPAQNAGTATQAAGATGAMTNAATGSIGMTQPGVTMQDGNAMAAQEAMQRIETLVNDGVLSQDDLADLSDEQMQDLMVWALAGAGGMFPPVAIATESLTACVTDAMQADVLLPAASDTAFALAADALQARMSQTGTPEAVETTGAAGPVDMSDAAAILADMAGLDATQASALSEALAGVDTEQLDAMTDEELRQFVEKAVAAVNETVETVDDTAVTDAVPTPILKALVRVMNRAEEAATGAEMLDELAQRTNHPFLEMDRTISDSDTDHSADADDATDGEAASTDAMPQIQSGIDMQDMPEFIIPEIHETDRRPDAPAATHRTDMPVAVTATDGAPAGAATARPAETSRHYIDVQENIERLGAALRVSIRNNVSNARIDLTPTELGRVTVALSIRNGVVAGTLTADTPEAAKLLAGQIGQLRDTLTAQGITMGNFDISYGTNDNGSSGNWDMSGQQRHGRDDAPDHAPEASVPEDADNATEAQTTLNYDGLGYVNTTA